MRVLLFAIVTFCLTKVGFPQDLKGLDLFEQKLVSQPGFKFPGDLIPAFVKADENTVREEVLKAGGKYKFTRGGISCVEIPKESWNEFVDRIGAIKIDGAFTPVQPLLDSSIVTTQAYKLQRGDSPLTIPLKGEGVIIGFIDDGIDFTHPDFKDNDGNTRIRYLWDQKVTAQNPPTPYDYGREWTATEINAGLCNHTETNSGGLISHGSNVIGIAAGNGLTTIDTACTDYLGMAPDADIIVVAINFTNFISNVADAADYIFKKADALGKPCVINISYGTYFGGRDACDPASAIMEALLNERDGRVIVAAAGNAGDQAYHLGYDVIPTDTFFTWFRYNANAGAGDVFISGWIDTADFNNVYFSFTADDPSTWTTVASTRFFNISEFTPTVIKQAGVYDDQGNFVAQVRMYMEKYCENGKYLFQAIINPTNQSHYWRFSTTGSGRIDIWSSSLQTNPNLNSSDMVVNTPLPADFPPIIHYKFPDTDMTMVSSFQNSDAVITVANFSNRASYVDANKTVQLTGEVSGELYFTSSHGPTRDGRQKPDVAAPGTTTISAGNLAFINLLIGSGQGFKVGCGGKHSRNGGTSMASPVVSGIVALYLQQHPEATWCEVKKAITLGTDTDGFTGSTPNNLWGYGKINAWKMIQNTYVAGCTNPDALNYSPLAVCDNGTCIASVSGCMDNTALNFNPDANVMDTSACIYEIPLSSTSADALLGINLFPNPSNGEVWLAYEIRSNVPFERILIDTYDALGSVISHYVIRDTSGKINLRLEGMAAGVYGYHVSLDGLTVKAGSFVINR